MTLLLASHDRSEVLERGGEGEGEAHSTVRFTGPQRTPSRSGRSGEVMTRRDQGYNWSAAPHGRALVGGGRG